MFSVYKINSYGVVMFWTHFGWTANRSRAGKFPTAEANYIAERANAYVTTILD